MDNPAVSIVKWVQSQFPAILPGGVIDSRPLMKPFVNKTITKYQVVKDRLIKEARSQKSEWNSAGNGAISGGGIQPLRRSIRTSSQSLLSDGLKTYQGHLKKQPIHRETFMSTNHVELRNVTKRFGEQRAVNQIDLVLKVGGSVDLAGRNGAGKSIIIKLILSLIAPNEGEVVLLGEHTDNRADAQVCAWIGCLPETIALHPSLTGIETVAFYTKLKRQPLAKNRELLERAGTLQAAGHRTGTCSRKVRQRLTLTQTLLGESKVSLFDEPIIGLDPASRQIFYEVVRELNGRGATVLLSTHALAELDGHVDHIMVMRNGTKVTDGSMDESYIQSGLPLTVTIRLKGRVPSSEHWQYLDDLPYHTQCKAEERMASLSELGDLNHLNYIDIHTLTLDDTYVQLLKREEV